MNAKNAIRDQLAERDQMVIVRLREALEPFAKMAQALKNIDDNLVITSDHLERNPEFPNYYLATRDLRLALAAFNDSQSWPSLGEGGCTVIGIEG